jgi:hypothetical protein
LRPHPGKAKVCENPNGVDTFHSRGRHTDSPS